MINVPIGDVALLKTMDSDSLASMDNLLMADALAPWKVSNSENLLKVRNQVSTNAMELNRLYAQMVSITYYFFSNKGKLAIFVLFCLFFFY